MASHLLVLLLLSTVGFSAAANNSSPSQFPLVQSTCNASTDYDLYVATLVTDPWPSSSTADLRGLCAIAVSVDATNDSASQEALANSSFDDGHIGWLLRDCAGKYGQTRIVLVGARKSVDKEVFDDAFIEVGVAAEYLSVCRTNNRRSRSLYPTELAQREIALERPCIIAIDITGIVS